jgi:hypothetical protein
MARARQRAASGRRPHRAGPGPVFRQLPGRHPPGRTLAGIVLALALAGLSACADGGFAPDTFRVLPNPVNGGDGRAFHRTVSLGSGDVLLIGGQDAAGLPLNGVRFAERYRWNLGVFVGEDMFPSATGRVAPVAAPIGATVVAAGGQVTGVPAAAGAPQYFPLSPSATMGGERYDPGTGITLDFGLAGGAAGAALTQGPGGGWYLIGGRDDGGNLRSEILRFDTGSGAFVGTGVSLIEGREGHTATRLSSGDILIVGGWGLAGTPLQSAELFDPGTPAIASASSPLLPRAQHTATADAGRDKVLLYGGFKGIGVLAGAVASTEVAEVYDAGAGTFRTVSSAPMPTPRVYHTATLLNNGDVLLVGGVADNAGTVTDTVQVFDPLTETVRDAAGTLAFPRFGHSATRLPDGTVLVTGGLSAPGTMVPEAERYLPQVL